MNLHYFPVITIQQNLDDFVISTFHHCNFVISVFRPGFVSRWPYPDTVEWDIYDNDNKLNQRVRRSILW